MKNLHRPIASSLLTLIVSGAIDAAWTRTAAAKSHAADSASSTACSTTTQTTATTTSSSSAPASTSATATEANETAQSIDEIGPQAPKKLASSTLTFEIRAPRDFAWQVLVDFANYPKYFTRIDTCKVTKTQGDLVFIESYLKKQMFVSQTCQHTVNDLREKPSTLKWKVLDGNFRYVDGSWQINQLPNKPESCQVIYVLRADSGPIIPARMVSFVLHFVQKEIVDAFRKNTEAAYKLSKKQ